MIEAVPCPHWGTKVCRDELMSLPNKVRTIKERKKKDKDHDRRDQKIEGLGCWGQVVFCFGQAGRKMGRRVMIAASGRR